MARRKLARFDYNYQADNVIERGKELYTTIKGEWRSKFFKNDNPIVLELACGRGEYSVSMGQLFPDKNFIGIDIKGDRIARGSKRVVDLRLNNVAFLRTGIQYLEDFFVQDEIDEIWLIHPDPQPRDKEEKKRLTFPTFLKLYKRILKDSGKLHLKTDNSPLYEYSLGSIESENFKILKNTDDLYNSDFLKNHLDIHGNPIETYYEKMFKEKGFKINYIESQLFLP